MKERYKVLGAVLSLREFTVADLSVFSGVKQSTVRTVLAREAELLREIGRDPSPSKGGRFTRYRLREDKVDGFRAELHELYRQLGAYVEGEISNRGAGEYSPPLPIVAAQDALLLRFPRVTDTNAKIELIEFARTAKADQASQAYAGGKAAELLELHLLSVQVLIDLSSAELALAEKLSVTEYAAAILRDFFLSLLERGSRLGQATLCSNLLNRFLTSPMLGMVAFPRIALNKETSLFSVLQTRSDPRAAEVIRSLGKLSEECGGDAPLDAVVDRQPIGTMTEAVSNSRRAVQVSAKGIQLEDGHFFPLSGDLLEEIKSRADSDDALLILGETGVGKDIAAMCIHQLSSRKERVFLTIDCGAMRADLLEVELFGNEQIGVTGVIEKKPGKFEICDGGTLFLDEIGEIPAAVQAKLLRFLSDGTYSRLGGDAILRANVRVLATTFRDLQDAVTKGTFREDLYQRLNGSSLRIAPLRERRGEIPILVAHFMRENSMKYGLEPRLRSAALVAAFGRYRWPGNIRELENVINRFLILGNEAAIIAELDSTKSEPADFAALQRDLQGRAIESAGIASVFDQGLREWEAKSGMSKGGFGEVKRSQ